MKKKEILLKGFAIVPIIIPKNLVTKQELIRQIVGKNTKAPKINK